MGLYHIRWGALLLLLLHKSAEGFYHLTAIGTKEGKYTYHLFFCNTNGFKQHEAGAMLLLLLQEDTPYHPHIVIQGHRGGQFPYCYREPERASTTLGSNADGYIACQGVTG
jgi:hypothetical protein